MISLRPIAADDRPFLQRVYASTRAAELRQVDWDDQHKEQFVLQQFNAQHSHYTTHFPDAEYLLILKDERPIGRLYIDRRADEIRLIDIALLPEHQGAGTGSFLLRSILAEAREKTLPVTIHVEKFNPAMALYERLGFERIEDQGVYYLMRWQPGAASEQRTGSG